MKKNKVIYMVTTYGNRKNPYDSRNVGAFDTLKEAKQSVDENWGDIHECNTWLFCVIEEFDLNMIYSIGRQMQWYKSLKTKFKAIPEPPKMYTSICNIGMG
jgi:hypothetical protein